jgi:hypothetical protein
MVSGLESARLKLARAAEHIEAIKSIVGDYTKREPSSITKRADGKNTLTFSGAPPPIIAVLAGEVVYQTRSALDHLIFDLVQLNPKKKTLPKGWDKRCDFPLTMEIPVKGDPPVRVNLPLPYGFFDKTLPGISLEAHTFIESVQPYYAKDGGGHLRLLGQLSNIDKHRHLHIIRPQAYVTQEATLANGYNSLSVKRTEDGAEVQPEHPPEMLKEGSLMVRGVCHPFVSFDESALGKGAATLPVDHILQLCLDGVQRIIVPAFQKFLQIP